MAVLSNSCCASVLIKKFLCSIVEGFSNSAKHFLNLIFSSSAEREAILILTSTLHPNASRIEFAILFKCFSALEFLIGCQNYNWSVAKPSPINIRQWHEWQGPSIYSHWGDHSYISECKIIYIIITIVCVCVPLSHPPAFELLCPWTKGNEGHCWAKAFVSQ